MNIEEYIPEENVVFSHDSLSEKNRRHRKGDALNWRKDRYYNRYPYVDKKLAKRRLHKMNRRTPELSRSTYYKTGYSLEAVCYGLT